MADIRQSSAWANYLKSIGWKIEKIDDVFIYIKHFPILGNFVKLQRPENIDQKTINYIDKKYSPFQFCIEPLNNTQVKLLNKLNFKLSKSPSLPTKTLIINLNKPENVLLKSLSQKTRYNIKLSKKKNINIIETNSILDFTNFWRKNFERQRLVFLSQQKNIICLHKAFGKNNKILLAKKDNQIIAVLLLLFFDKTSYYMYAASSDIGKTNFAPTLLTWHAILLSKKLGFKIFDFDGIYDERFPVKSWLGFTKFKYGFSNSEIFYPGIFSKKKLL